MRQKSTRLISIIDLDGPQDSLLQRLFCFGEEEWPEDELYLHIMTSERWGDRSRDEVQSNREDTEIRKSDQTFLLGDAGGGKDEHVLKQVQKVVELALERGRVDKTFSKRNR